MVKKKISRKKKIKFSKFLFIILLIAGFFIYYPFVSGQSQSKTSQKNWWDFQSIDTMKYSRDLAREKNSDTRFEKIIDTQVKNIADIGSTHVAIATPYDSEFLPYLKKWVTAARKYNLKVWFRGNWSGWEGWFGYKPITREDHISKTEEFIKKNQDIFINGDIFTACPECENGGPGDPRETKDIVGYRNFLILEYKTIKKAFDQTGKKVSSNYNSTNYDVATLIMDKKTTQDLDGLVVIDHYVASADTLASDILEIASKSGGEIVLGEFGAPIPDIHGQLNDGQQAQWLGDSLERLSEISELKGLNYWVSVGGSTELWDTDGKEKPAVQVLKNFYKPQIIDGVVINQTGEAIVNASINFSLKTAKTNKQGKFTIPVLGENPVIGVIAQGYKEQKPPLGTDQKFITVTLTKDRPSIFDRLKLFLYNLFHK